jgi:hypothetical protein
VPRPASFACAPAARTFEGLVQPSDDATFGVGLFASSDVPIDSKGSVLGRAHQGAFLSLAAIEKDTARVILPFHLEGRVALAALTTNRMEPPAPASYPNAVENASIRLETGGQTDCSSPTGLLEATDQGLRVAQTIGGIEISGIATAIALCPQPAALHGTIPGGWRAPSIHTTAFASARDFFRMWDGACAGWRFAPPAALEVLSPVGDMWKASIHAGKYAAPLIETATYSVSPPPPARIESPIAITLDFRSSVARDARGKVVKKAELGWGEGVGSAPASYMIVGQSRTVS